MPASVARIGDARDGNHRLAEAGALQTYRMDRPLDWDPPSGTPPLTLLKTAWEPVRRDLLVTGYPDVTIAADVADLSPEQRSPFEFVPWLTAAPPYMARAWLFRPNSQGADGIEVYDYETLAAAIARIADTVSDYIADEYYEAWPVCPACRARHPLGAVEHEGRAWWTCGKARVSVLIGDLRDVT